MAVVHAQYDHYWDILNCGILIRYFINNSQVWNLLMSHTTLNTRDKISPGFCFHEGREWSNFIGGEPLQLAFYLPPDRLVA